MFSRIIIFCRSWNTTHTKWAKLQKHEAEKNHPLERAYNSNHLRRTNQFHIPSFFVLNVMIIVFVYVCIPSQHISYLDYRTYSHKVIEFTFAASPAWHDGKQLEKKKRARKDRKCHYRVRLFRFTTPLSIRWWVPRNAHDLGCFCFE